MSVSIKHSDQLIRSWTTNKLKLPVPASDSEDADSSDDEPCAVVSKFAQGNRRADPVGKSLYYPAGDLPRRWHGRRRGKQGGPGYSTLLGMRVLNLEVAGKWQSALKKVSVSTETSDKGGTMSNFCNIAKELHSKLKDVKSNLQQTNWQVREVGARWRSVGSSVKSTMLRTMSLAKTLYTKLDRILFPATKSMTSNPATQSTSASRRSSRMRASVAAASPTLLFESLPVKIQEMMREVGMDGWTAQDAHKQLQQVLCKTESQEASSRLKFRKVKQLRQVFDDIDRTGDGSVDRVEFCQYMSQLETRRPHLRLFNEADSIFSSLDRRKNGCLCFADLLLLWYPYLTPKECKELAEAAPSRHEKPPQKIDEDHTWGPGDIAVMKREFAMLDTSGDGFVDALKTLVLLIHDVYGMVCLEDSRRRPVTSVQEFETGMLKLWGITPQTKGRKRYLKMLREWFSTIDMDGSGEVDFDEFQAWYMKSVADAQDAGVL